MKSLNRKLHHCTVPILVLVLAATPAMAAPTPTDVLDLHQRWLDSTDNFLANIYVVAVEGKKESHVAKGLLLYDHLTGDLSFQRVEVCEEIPQAATSLLLQRWAGGARAGVGGIGYTDITLVPGPFRAGSWDLFSRGSTAAETLARLDTIASDARALEGSGDLAGLVGLVVSFDQDFKRGYQRVVEQMLGGELMAGKEWSEAQELELWFDAEDGRLHQVSSITLGVRRDVLFEYAAVDLSSAELTEMREKLAVRITSKERSFSSFVELMDALVAARDSRAATRAGLPLVAGILLLLVGRTLRRLR